MTDARFALLSVVGWLALAVSPAPAVSQAPLFLVGPETEVSSVGFRFSGGASLDPGRLEEQVALAGPGPLFGIRSAIGLLPLIPSPSRDRFDPPTVLRDVVRLERFYRQEGFPEASVEYAVALDTTSNTVSVTYVIAEGRPLLLDTLVIRPAGGASMEEILPEELVPGWRELEREVATAQGMRLSTSLRARELDRVLNWLRDRGYPYPSGTLSTEETDTLEHAMRARLLIEAQTGGRMRVGDVVVEGNRRLGRHVVLREVPLGPGDWFSRARLAEGQSELFGLDLVRLAVTETLRDTLDEGRVGVRVRISEAEPYLLSGRAGWGTGSGISADASWSHRNFLGGARTLEISTVARTGLLAPDASRARRYGLSVSLRQPWLWDHRVEGVFRPFVEYRDDLRDESVQLGAQASALYQRGPRRNVTLRYSLTTRYVIRAGTGVILGQDADFATLLAALDTLDLDRRTSSLAATGRWARAAVVTESPRTDWSLFGSAEITGPAGLSTVEYGRLVGEVTVVLPVRSGIDVRARLGGGRVAPFGVSVPAPDGSDRLETYFRLRDAVLTAGGAQDVRGWGTDLLGPKAPDVVGVDGAATATARYVPLGGLARWTGSFQLEVPLPFVGRPHGLHAFVDAGRIWTPDGRFLPTATPLVPDQLGDQARVGTGIGISIGTPVGPVQLDLGYKLNPSVLDVREPGAVGRALLEGRSVSDVPAERIRRFHLHLSVGGIT